MTAMTGEDHKALVAGGAEGLGWHRSVRRLIRQESRSSGIAPVLVLLQMARTTAGPESGWKCRA
jgi:hypothetical protein